MIHRHGHGVVVALAILACAAAALGCGLGPGDEVGEVSLRVTSDYGADILAEADDEAVESDTVLRLLDRNAEITTRYGGGFVESIEGLAGGSEGGRLTDWFFYVNGVESPVGSSDRPLDQGDVVWWDHHDWTAVMRVPAVVGAYPEPFRSGYEGEPLPTIVVCRTRAADCEQAERRLAGDGADLAESGEEAIRVLVGPWSRIRADRAAGLLDAGPDHSGVFARFSRRAGRGGGWLLEMLDAAERPVSFTAAATGLVAAVRRGQGPPTWLLTGTDPDGVAAAVRRLDEGSLVRAFALAVSGGRETRLPVRAR